MSDWMRRGSQETTGGGARRDRGPGGSRPPFAARYSPSERRRPVWELPHARVLFHYTQPDWAEQIFAERLYLVSDRPDPVHGHGFWATDLAPGSVSDSELLGILFKNRRPASYIVGVLVLLRVEEFRDLGGHEFLWPARASTVIDLSDIALGVGRRGPEGWRFSRELLRVVA